jgi:hypothetical protein
MLTSQLVSWPSDSISGNARVYPHAYAWRLSTGLSRYA